MELLKKTYKILKNKYAEFKNILTEHYPNDSIIGISISTLFELRKHIDLYQDFLNIFSIIPLVFVKNYNQILQDEINHYPNFKEINPILHAVSPLSKNKFGKLDILLDHLFQRKDILEVEQKWDAEKKSILGSILSLKKNFPPQKDRYTSIDAIKFVEEATLQQIIMQYPDFAQKIINQNKTIDINSFPSLKIQLYTVFYRFYDGDRKPEIQDVFDILISSSIPYIDIFYTERFQAEIIKKVKNRDSFINNVQVFTIRELRDIK